MKRKTSISQIIIVVLIVGLFISLTLNGIQYNCRNHSEGFSLKGSYSTDSVGINSRYLIFDKEEYFCLYSQTVGILEEGKYKKYGENLYKLDSISGNRGSILLTKEGVYYSSNEGNLELFHRYSDTPIYLDDWEH